MALNYGEFYHTSMMRWDSTGSQTDSSVGVIRGLELSNDQEGWWDPFYGNERFPTDASSRYIRIRTITLSYYAYPGSYPNFAPAGVPPALYPGIFPGMTATPPYVLQPLVASNPTDILTFNIFATNVKVALWLFPTPPDSGFQIQNVYQNNSFSGPFAANFPMTNSAYQRNKTFGPDGDQYIFRWATPLITREEALSASAYKVQPKVPISEKVNTRYAAPAITTAPMPEFMWWTCDCSYFGQVPQQYTCTIPVNIRSYVDPTRHLTENCLRFTAWANGPGYDPAEAILYGFTDNYYLFPQISITYDFDD